MAAAWDSGDVTTVAPELVTTPPIAAEVFQFFIDMVDREINAAVFGARIVEAGALLTAHYMIRLGYGKNAVGAGGAAGAVGSISNVTVGRVSVGFSAGAAAGGSSDPKSAELATTRPGSIYLGIVKSLGLTPIVLTGREIAGLGAL